MREGSLCTGYDGLGMAVRSVLGGELAWVSDIDKGANKILAHRYPDVPNLGDLTALDWRDVEPVDVLTAGFPCQDVSHAGKRAGLRPGTRTGIWSHIAEAVEVMRPALCVFENVRGLLSAEAHSDVEPCPWCVGDELGGSLRALGAVLGDLAERGYDCRVTGVRAADVGAPHGRFRVFVVATDAAGERHEWGGRARDGRPGPADGRLLPTPIVSDAATSARDYGAGEGYTQLRDVAHFLLPTPRATDGTKGGPNQRGSGGDLMLPSAVMELLPTPRASDPAGEMSRSSEGFRPQLGEVARLLPTPMAGDAKAARNNTATRHKIPPAGIHPGDTLSDISHKASWGDYAPAIARWETVLGRPAPPPTETGPKGTPRLSPIFVEFLMGLPECWVTDVPALTRNEQLKALGNGVVPQQAAAALASLLDLEQAA